MLAKYKNLKRKNLIRGFGLIELLITIALLGILTALAVNNFGTWIQNTQTRSVAEALQNGIRLAQTEAIKLSESTSFNITGNAWTVTAMQRGNNNASADNTIGTAGIIHNGIFPDSRSISILTAKDFSLSTTLRFNSMGRLVFPTNNVKYIISNSRGDRRMQISVSIAGRVRMCDPDKTLSESNPDGVDTNGNC